MQLISIAFKKFFEQAKHLPGIRDWRNRRHYKHFLSAKGYASYYGVFSTFSEARERVPQNLEFNQRELTEEYSAIRMHRVFPYDYPVLLALTHAFSAGAKRIFDIGGSVGVHYHAYGKMVQYPQSLVWTVCETPEVAKVGQEIAARSGVSNLFFTANLDTNEVMADIWISAGALQYIENGRPSILLENCLSRPAHVILNKLPMYDGPDFVTVQNIGNRSYSPLHVFNKKKLTDELTALGYVLKDEWEVPERSFYLPNQPTKSFNRFSGMYFRLRETNAGSGF